MQIDELREQLRRREIEQRAESSPLSINGYVDFGFFVPIGNDGVGWRRDVGNRAFPQHSNFAWTFMGDILSTAVNTRGEVASLGQTTGTLRRFDAINSNGAPGFIANEVNLRVGYRLSSNAVLRTSVNFLPRDPAQGAPEFTPGDYMEVDLAEMEYVLTDDGKTSIFVGKMLPVFGIEYKERKSDQRFGITPSLMNRYTTGPQLGLKFRSKLLNDWLILAGSVTNNHSNAENFHFQAEIDRNAGKTLNGRAAISIPVGDAIGGFMAGDRLEIGGSGAWGPQDRATDSDGEMWFWGVDLQYQGANYALKGQFMRGNSTCRAAQGVWDLDLNNGGYLELNVLPLPFLGVLARGEFRDAFVSLGTERAYVTKEQRFTGGLRVIFNPRVVLKAEYLWNRTYGGVPQFRHDIFTSSLVLAY